MHTSKPFASLPQIFEEFLDLLHSLACENRMTLLPCIFDVVLDLLEIDVGFGFDRLLEFVVVKIVPLDVRMILDVRVNDKCT